MDLVKVLETVLAYLQAIEHRLRAVERRADGPRRRGPGRLRETTCRDCGRTFARGSVLRERCDACRRTWKRQQPRKKR